MRLLLALFLLATPAAADAPIFVIDQTQLPFDLGPGAPANAPARAANSPNAAANSSASSANSGSSFANSPRNPANEKRLIFTAEGNVLGYYAPNNSGTLNLFDVNGKRVAYRPRGSKSLFSNDGRWCGTVASNQGGGFAFGIIQGCAGLF
ncbi:hypothetical protein [Paracoccus sulfuroxidans]|uniref:Uncharacterized protein n=1 Tax=Paracoccus sulfuroxidans TaxID=384678 RepID=A0A562NAQ6_9RHOB|nr:hypothetical protein [Paracoccus sulfuroxidans]TWI29245.1 hypothetical protein IQ24_03725 [Paracoccus sulfuroxidans]